MTKSDILHKPAIYSSSRMNSKLLGHENAEKLFFDLITEKTLTHSWMFSGPKGIGKASLAYRIARYLLCTNDKKTKCHRPSIEEKRSIKTGHLWVDPKLDIFQRVSVGSHADLLTIERKPDRRGKLASNIIIDDVRKINNFFNKTAAEGGWRIVIIDSADEMTLNAANALLKNLEEPPFNTLLLLISHNPSSLLPTIRSRCRDLPLSILEHQDMIKLLNAYLPDLTDADRMLLAVIGEGRIGYAITLSESGGLQIYKDILELLNSMPKLNFKNLDDFCTKLAKSGAEDIFLNSMQLLNGILARLIRGHFMDDEKLIMPETHLQKTFLEYGDLDTWINLWENINNFQNNHKLLNLDPKQTTLNIFLGIEQIFNPQ